MGKGYVVVDNKRTVCADSLVAIINKKGKRPRSEIILEKNRFGSMVTAKKLSERIDSGKKAKRLF